VNGGAIKYTYYAPDISINNTFKNNTAMYGEKIASYPVQMRFVVENTDLKRSNTGVMRNLNILN
jgi:hypothetical protein